MWRRPGARVDASFLLGKGSGGFERHGCRLRRGAVDLGELALGAGKADA